MSTAAKKLTALDTDSVPAIEIRKCSHCGNTFQPRFEAEQFCCSGCRVVHELIQTGGFGSFYELLGRRVLQPADNGEIPADQLAEIEEAVIEAEKVDEASPASLVLRIGNLSCTACVWLIDHLFQRHTGSLKISSDTARSTLTLWWNPGEFDVSAFVQDLYKYGYPASLVNELDDEAPGESRALVTRLGVTGGLALNTMAFTLPSYLGIETTDDLARLFTLVAFASATLALAVGGSYFFQRAWKALRLRALHMDVPISLGLIAAWLGSVGGLLFGVEDMLYFDFVATFNFLMLSGRWLHLRLLEKNRRQLWARERDLSATFRIKDGSRERIPLKKVEPGDILEIPGGAMLPVDSELLGDHNVFHLDWINGEPDPVPFRTGQQIPAGARNGARHPIEVKALHHFTDSFLDHLLRKQDTATEESTEHRSPVLRYYLLAVLITAFAGGSTWLAMGKGISDSLQVCISILVVSCPCALGLALPLLDEMLLSRLKQKGIFLRNHSLWKRLRNIRNLAFDKTGTLTEPVKRLTNPDVLETLDDEALQALRCLTHDNRHPVGRAIHEVLIARFGNSNKSSNFPVQGFPSRGVSCRVGGGRWRLGRRGWACPEETDPEETGCTLSKDGVHVATFHIDEAIRDGAIDQMNRLRKHGFNLRILSGDPDLLRVRETAHKLGIPAKDVYANLSAEEKADLITENGGSETLFIGDGGNDSLAFRASGASGTPATGIRAIESQADFVFTGRGFHALSQLIDASVKRKHLVTTIFIVAVAYNIIAVGLCLSGHMNPLLAAVLMPLSSLVTTAIATRV